MTSSPQSLQFRLNQQRFANVEGYASIVAVLLFLLFTTVFLPQLLIKYVYATQQLTEAPMLLDLIPAISFVVGVVYTVVVLVFNVLRTVSIMRVQKVLQAMDGEITQGSTRTNGRATQLASALSATQSKAAFAQATKKAGRRPGRPPGKKANHTS
jgi:hypothetical protein